MNFIRAVQISAELRGSAVKSITKYNLMKRSEMDYKILKSCHTTLFLCACCLLSLIVLVSPVHSSNIDRPEFI